MYFSINPATVHERQCAYAQPDHPEREAGCIGYLRGDFGRDGDEFWTTWFDVHPKLKTSEFTEAFDKVINALRFAEAGGGLLKNRSCMNIYCRTQPESSFDGNYTQEYAFRIDTAQYSFMLRCIPVRGDYNFYCFCYVRQILDNCLSATM